MRGSRALTATTGARARSYSCESPCNRRVTAMTALRLSCSCARVRRPDRNASGHETRAPASAHVATLPPSVATLASNGPVARGPDGRDALLGGRTGMSLMDWGSTASFECPWRLSRIAHPPLRCHAYACAPPLRPRPRSGRLKRRRPKRSEPPSVATPLSVTVTPFERTSESALAYEMVHILRSTCPNETLVCCVCALAWHCLRRCESRPA